MLSSARPIQQQQTQSKIEVFSVESDSMKSEIYRFRYEIYVEAMQRRQLWADHKERMIREPIDESARNYVAMIDGQIVGVIRANSANDKKVLYYRKLYKIDNLQFDDLSKVQITTKLMVRPGSERMNVAPALFQAFALDSYRLGFQIDIMDCNMHLIPLFEKMGYFRYGGWVFHKEYGSVMPMIMAADTINYFDSIRSILRKPASNILVDNCYGGYEFIRRIATAPQDASLRKSYVELFVKDC
jgi:hypothetical protein